MGGGGEKSRGEKDLRMRRGKGMEDTHYNNVEFKQHFFPFFPPISQVFVTSLCRRDFQHFTGMKRM